MAGSERELRRYRNRKLYDMVASRYVNFDDVAALVRQGIAIKVVDHGTGRDRTSHLLAQVVAQEELVEATGVALNRLLEILRFTSARVAKPVEVVVGDSG
jgi:polyhydroxyalkanoate synthesis repressor PhaR